jgi:hypothetical protein
MAEWAASFSSCARGINRPIPAGSEAGSREYSSPGGEADDEWFVDNLIGTINIGARLEDATWDLALRILPQAWWDRRTAELAAAARTARPLV